MAKPPTPLREWVPSCFLLMHDEQVHTSIRYCPMHIQRADVTYFSNIKIFGRSPTQPVWSTESGPMHIDDVFTVESGDIAKALGTDQLFHYGECYNWTPDMTPPTPNTAMNVQLHFGSDDGSFHGHLASFFIFGAPRRVQRGERYYESFPAALVNEDNSLSVFIVNPYVRPSKARVHVIDVKNGTWKSEEFSVRGKGGGQWNSKGGACPLSAHPVGIVVETELKTSSFFATRAGDGRMIGLDHGHSFLTQVLGVG